MSRLALVLPILLLAVAPALSAQQTETPKTSPYAAIPAGAANAPNPVKSSPESLARGKKWWTLDCAMCHGDSGNGKGDTARDMKLTIPDFTEASTLRDRADGELYYVIKNGHHDMPPEGERVTVETGWDLVNYVRSLAKSKEANAKQ